MSLLALPFPAIDPIAIEIGPFAIRWYALAYIAGVGLGWLLIRRIVATDALWGGTNRPTREEIDDFVMWALVGIIFGGRLGYVLFYDPARFLAHPAEIVEVWKGGMSFHGGFLGMCAVILAFSRGRSFSALTLFDLAAAAAPIGLFFGRLANFVNGELWGRVTTAPIGMVFPHAGPDPRHPSQLYQAAMEGLVLFVLMLLAVFVWRRLPRPGAVAGLFVAGYGVARIVGELFREPDAQLGYLAFGLTMGQILSLPMVAAGLVLLVHAARRPSREG